MTLSSPFLSYKDYNDFSPTDISARRDLNDDDLVSQLKWLGSLISAKKALKQIINLSARIFNLVQGSPKSKTRRKRKLLPDVEFHIMPIHVINAFGEFMYDGSIQSSQILTDSDFGKAAMAEPNWVKLLERFSFHSDFRSHNTSL